MAIVILQGPQLNSDIAAAAAERLGGALEQRADHYRVHGNRMPAPALLDELRATLSCDINPLPAVFDPARVRLVVTDMDSTLINIECIDEIADFAGLKPQVAAITEAAMRGELNIEQSHMRRVAQLAGLDASALEHVYQARLRAKPGADVMLACIQAPHHCACVNHTQARPRAALQHCESFFRLLTQSILLCLPMLVLLLILGGGFALLGGLALARQQLLQLSLRFFRRLRGRPRLEFIELSGRRRCLGVLHVALPI